MATGLGESVDAPSWQALRDQRAQEDQFAVVLGVLVLACLVIPVVCYGVHCLVLWWLQRRWR